MSRTAKVLARIAREPVMLGELIKQAIALGVAFGLKLTTEQTLQLCAFVSLTGAFFVRMFVSPGGRDEGPKDPPRSDSLDPIPPAPPPPPRSPLPPDAAAVMLGLSLLFAPALVGCSTTPAQVQAVQAREVARAAYASGAIALNALDVAHKAWVDSTAAATPADIEAFKKTLGALKTARAALEEAKPFVEKGGGGSEVKEKLLAGLDFALLGGNEMARAGVRIPPEALEALAAARALLGGV
jgi:hypothetical protein